MTDDRRKIFDRVKRATVALAFMRTTLGPKNRPFEILGSGVCIDPSGVIVTCRHVIEAVMAKDVAQQTAEATASQEVKAIPALTSVQIRSPQVLFFQPSDGSQPLKVALVQARLILTKTERDLAAIRLGPHDMFPDGFPALDIAAARDLYEGQDIAACGFPLGTYLSDQIGTVTSSFTSGIISSILPAAGSPDEHITGYQLDLTATKGNSGGPVFAMDTGNVFGIVEQGVFGSDHQTVLPGITKAEAINVLITDGSVAKLRKAVLSDDGWPPPSLWPGKPE